MLWLLVGCTRAPGRPDGAADAAGHDTGAGATDTGTADTDAQEGPFVPAWLNIDAHFGVDLTGAVVPVYDPLYAALIPPQIVVYIASDAWTVGDWSNDRHLCTVTLDASGADAVPTLAADRSLWLAFTTGILMPVLDDGCGPKENEQFQVATYTAGLTWTVGVGPIRTDLEPDYASDPQFVGGYTVLGTGAVAPGDGGYTAVATADVVDPYTLMLAFTYTADYAYYVPIEDASALATGDARGLAPAWYHVVGHDLIAAPPVD
jgi:hypothetical protein